MYNSLKQSEMNYRDNKLNSRRVSSLVLTFSSSMLKISERTLKRMAQWCQVLNLRRL